MNFADFKKKLRMFWRRNKRSISFAIGLVGSIFTILGVWELLVIFETLDAKYEFPLMKEVGFGSWFFALIGSLVALGGFIYFYDYNKKHKQFEELIDTDSKATFIRNLVELEELAISLGPDYEKRVMAQREKYKVKTL